MNTILCGIILTVIIYRPTLQNCPEEITRSDIKVIWRETQTANNVKSVPLCYNDETLVTRNCTDSNWTPALDDLAPCSKIVKYFDLTTCPPGYHKIMDDNNNYCYQITGASAWDYPCFTSGGGSVITDLSDTEYDNLVGALKTMNISNYFWLPAHRRNLFHPLVWSIPGPNWGERVTTKEHVSVNYVLTKYCLLLDIENNVLITESCAKVYPSLCFYLNDFHYPTTCPSDYYALRFSSNDGACYGIATSDSPEGMTFNDFLIEKCDKPMSNENDFLRFIFMKIAEINELPDDTWCWFKVKNMTNSFELPTNQTQTIEGIINNAGVSGLISSNTSLSCMACQSEIKYPETQLMFEYNDVQNVIYLTVYYPSGLWKYYENDKGIQCFSDAQGFVRVVDINNNPLIEIIPQEDLELSQIEKIVYVIDLVTDTSAQYWCEGHTSNFSFITTEKIIVNPKGNKMHVFSLVISYNISNIEIESMRNLNSIVNNVEKIFDAKKVLLMDILNYSSNDIMILLHLHILVNTIHDDKVLDLQETFNSIKSLAEMSLPDYNYTFVNISSSVYCFPNTSMNSVKLDWGMTPIGHISAPKQFCLQSNGLPVKRHCEGSYMLGSVWGEVEGYCDTNYEASRATTYLYNFLRNPNRYIPQFLTEGLDFVLKDTDIIIPADIYYLSMSLQQISDIAHENITSIDETDIGHIAWIMDRVMTLDCDYLRLAQTLNSTNVIVDAISDIIETIATKNLNESSDLTNIAHQLTIQSQFIVQISYPDVNNITGIAIINYSESNNFTDMTIRPLYKDSTLEEVLSIENLEIATWLPSKLLQSIQLYNNSNEDTNCDDNFHVIITMYKNDAVFQELEPKRHWLNSRIVGISIPEYISNLEYPVPIVFKQTDETMDSFCGYWDFEPQQDNHVPGSWKRQGCFSVATKHNLTICECYHLTHFGQLLSTPNIGKNDYVAIVHGHSVALNVITLVGSFLSLLGISGIWITALIFSNWRKKAGTKVLLQLSTAIALPLLFIVYFNLDYSMFVKENDVYKIGDHKATLCIVLGALLHFSILASFMWMLITAVLQFIRYVRVLGVRRPSRFMIKFTLIGWVIPLIPVIITLALDPHNYIPAPSSYRKICYPSGYYLVGAVLVPICLILLINITLFLLVLYAISRGSNQRTKSTDMDLVGAQLRVSIFLFFLLGLTWVFGFFSFSNHLIWSYLFCLTSTIQGFVLFIYFVICDPNTRKLWVTLMRPQFLSDSRNSTTSINAG